ncbi:hypothetical protein [Clostridium tertium]|uniref:hypothetical protein n=1 Tax=Clostridium tertium TaxID=1559 RepID=UPI002027BA70|nr:hypothetical protein [Clostridium tertium]
MDTIDIRINVKDFTTVEEIISEFNKVDDLNKIYNIEIVLYKFVLPEILALIVAMYKNKKYEGFNFDIKLSGELNTYAERLDFYKHLEVDVEKCNRYSAEGRFVEITKFSSDNNINLVNSIMSIFEENLDIDRDVLSCMNYCLFEIVDNVQNHAKSPIDGYLVAQRYKNRGELRVSFIDCGIGIHKSLTEGKNEEYNNLTEEEALTECLKREVTNGNGMGNGLYHTSRFIESNRGILTIYSGKNKIIVSDSENEIKKIPYFKGTIVSLLIDLDNTVDLLDIFDGDIPVTVEEYGECIKGLW